MNKSNKLLSDIVSFRTYSKFLTNLGRRESLEESINRCMTMHLDRFPKLSRDIIKAFQQVHDFKIMPSMRSLQFAGDAILKNNARSYNCSALNIDSPRKFSEVLFLLLSGVGVGFSVQNHHVSQLPTVGRPREEGSFLIHDSIIGWSQALDALMSAYFYSSVKPVFDYSSIRPKGSYLTTTGSKAPGPEPLKYMLNEVTTKLKAAQGRKLSSIEVHDIICIISDCVLAGGIRRAALLSLFDKDDSAMLKAKSGEWWIKHPYRARANNSALLDIDSTTREEFDAIYDACRASGSGEPGISWSRNRDMLFNPCVTGDTEILTKEGYKQIHTLVDKEVEVWNGFEWSTVTPKITGHDQPLLEVKTRSGKTLMCTEYHKFYVIGDAPFLSFQKIAKNLNIGDNLITWKNNENGEEVSDVITSIKEAGVVKEVYCFNEPKRHTAVFNGIITGQCHEIALHDSEFCNLSTVNQTGIKNEKDFLSRVYSATLIGTIQASYIDFPYLSEKWKQNSMEEALIGVSFTGIADANSNISKNSLEKAAKLVLEVNAKYAKKIGMVPAARTTTLKPEGSSSAVLGSSSGIHARHSQYYLRRVRMNKDDALAHYLKTKIPHLVEDDLFSSTGIVVSIPQESPPNAILRESETALSLLKRTLHYNKHWISPGHRSGDNKHNVSVTISVKEHEWEELKEEMWKNRKHYSGISLLPYDGGSYKQAPFEDIDKQTFDALSATIPEMDFREIKEQEDNTSRVEQLACAGGVCEFTGDSK